jgi:hypothetical protein
VTVLRAHVWTDVGFAAALLVATGRSLLSRRRESALALLVLVAGFYALGCAKTRCRRCCRSSSTRCIERSRTTARHAAARVGVASTLVLAALFGACRSSMRARSRSARWRALAVFDLAALSIATDRVLLPAQMIGPAWTSPT